MSRIIKFRAWDKRNNSFASFEKLDYAKPNSPDMDLWSVWEKSMSISTDEDDRYLFEQFTGLHDSNDKEIYEGDIVEVTSGLQASFLATIIYKECSYRLETQDKGFMAGRLNDYIFSIVGNIHENKDLLNLE